VEKDDGEDDLFGGDTDVKPINSRLEKVISFAPD